MQFIKIARSIFTDALGKLNKNKSAKDQEAIKDAFSQPEVTERLEALERKLGQMGKSIPPGNTDPSEKMAKRKALGAVGKGVSLSIKNWSIGFAFWRALPWIIVLLLTYLLIFFAPKMASEFRNEAPELYCAAVYWINDNHTYDWCDERFGRQNGTPASETEGQN